MIAPIVAAAVAIGGGFVLAARNRRVKSPPPRKPPIEEFLASLKRGGRPTIGQYQAALLSCLVSGRSDTARRIALHHDPDLTLATSLLAWAIRHGRLGVVSALHTAFPELHPEPSTPAQNATEYCPELPAPDSELWDRFLSFLATQTVDYDGPNHLGIYEHHKRRIARFCDPPTLLGNASLQRDVITRDLHHLYREYQEPFQYVRAEITLPDETEHVISTSGVLTLLKYAGPRGAMQWLANPRERADYPTTTARFAQGNGIF